VTGIDLVQLSAMIGRQLPFFSVLVPFWLIWAFAGFRGMLAIWPAILVAGVSFAVPQFLVSNFHGPWLVDVIAALVSMGCLTAFLKIWQPKEIWTSTHPGPSRRFQGRQCRSPRSRRQGQRRIGQHLGDQGVDAVGDPDRLRVRLGHPRVQEADGRRLAMEVRHPGSGQGRAQGPPVVASKSPSRPCSRSTCCRWQVPAFWCRPSSAAC
jgi:hypothetical protein